MYAVDTLKRLNIALLGIFQDYAMKKLASRLLQDSKQNNH